MSKNAIQLLTEQHKEARELLAELSKTTDRGVKTRTELLDKLRQALTGHMMIEEEIFYPAYKQAVDRKKDKRLYYEAQEEHRAAKHVLKDVLRADPASLAFGGKVKVLEELIEHHADEEEKDMFPLAREVLSKEELAVLGARMAERLEQINGGRAWDRVQADAG
jgi:hemerythrin-like domain-containing protein